MSALNLDFMDPAMASRLKSKIEPGEYLIPFSSPIMLALELTANI